MTPAQQKARKDRGVLSRLHKRQTRDAGRRVLEAEPRLVTLIRDTRDGSVADLLAAVRAADWLLGADAPTRAWALRYLRGPIDAARGKAGRDPLDDPLPDEPDDGGLALRRLLSHPPDDPEEDSPMTIDVLALRIHTGADTAQARELVDHFFGGALPLQTVGLSAPADQTVAPSTPDDQEESPVPAANDVASEDVTRNAAPAETSDTPATPATDAAGLPWDERIHASSKALNADGTWRRKRGVDETTVARVEAELRGVSDDAAKRATDTDDDDLEALLGGDADSAPEEWPVMGVDGDTLNMCDSAEAFEAGLAEAIGLVDEAADVLTLDKVNEAALGRLSREARVRLRQVSDQRRNVLLEAAAKARDAATDAPPIDRSTLRKTLQAYTRVHGATALRAFLQKYGGARLEDIDPARYADMMAAARLEAA